MGIFSRTRDIIAANMTDLLDRAEDPAKMIRMIILEMEETLVEVRASAARHIADQKEMRRQIGKLDSVQEGWIEKAELALLPQGPRGSRQGRFGRKAEGRRSCRATAARRLRRSMTRSRRLRGRHRQAAKPSCARPALARIRFRPGWNRPRTAPSLREMYAGQKVEDAFSRFELLERRVDLRRGPCGCRRHRRIEKSLEEEISELRSADKIDAELAAMKARVAGRGRAEPGGLTPMDDVLIPISRRAASSSSGCRG